MSKQPPVLGIIGGLAAGKSTVARLLAERGAQVVDADGIAHGVLRDAGVRGALRESFGDGVFDAEGGVIHAQLAEVVFGRREQVERLNAIVHPPVLARIREQVAELKKRKDVPLVALDAALLIESGLDRDICDAVLYVEAAREQRLARALGRGLSQDQFEKREAAQLPEDVKRARAGLAVDNNGTTADLERGISGLWPELCMKRQGGQPVHPCANPTETKLPSRQP